jgi:hypothetical protein
LANLITVSDPTQRRSVRERLEEVWARRKPDPETGTEETAEGMETRTPTRGEFFGNLRRVAKAPPGADPPPDA